MGEIVERISEVDKKYGEQGKGDSEETKLKRLKFKELSEIDTLITILKKIEKRNIPSFDKKRAEKMLKEQKNKKEWIKNMDLNKYKKYRIFRGLDNG